MVGITLFVLLSALFFLIEMVLFRYLSSKESLKFLVITSRLPSLFTVPAVAFYLVYPFMPSAYAKFLEKAVNSALILGITFLTFSARSLHLL